MKRIALMAGAVLLALPACGDDDGQSNQNQNQNQNTALPICGDGVVDLGEECDDAALNSDVEPDACRTNCRRPYCGDGVPDDGEGCDGTDLRGATCEGAGFSGGALVCSEACEPQTTGCEGWNGVSVGTFHACGLRPDGTVRCWGRNQSGQLGNGTAVASDRPVEVVGITDAVQVSSGSRFTCLRLASGAVWCAGENAMGQLGDGTQASRSTAAPVDGVEDASTMSTGDHHACAVLVDGRVRCWGEDVYGEVGTGAVPTAPTANASPVEVEGIDSAVSVAAGLYSTCALFAEGTVACWGANNMGQLGDGSTTFSGAPVAVLGLPRIVAIAAEDTRACALDEDGTAWCWGGGPLGPKAGDWYATSATVQAVELEDSLGAIALGANHSCVLDETGRTFCWGSNEAGALGAGNVMSQPYWVRVSDLPASQIISAKGKSTCALGQDAAIRCWGYSAYGQLGPGAPAKAEAPGLVVGLGGSTQVDAGQAHSCAVVGDDGAVFCWGNNDHGQLGDGTMVSRPEPTQVPGLLGARQVTTGYRFSCAALYNGAVWCWGQNSVGQLGNGSWGTTLARQQVLNVWNVVDLSSNGDVSCALTAAGGFWCWGGGYANAQQMGASGYLAVAAAESHLCAITTAGQTYCMGSNDFGQLGIGAGSVDPAIPQLVAGIPAATAVSCGATHTCAIASGELYCWGSGLLGDGTLALAQTPVRVVNEDQTPLGGVTQVSTGLGITCAILDDGTAWCWGLNAEEQLGVPGLLDAPYPVQYSDFPDVISISAGWSHTCAVLSSGTLWCSGANHSGQLGNGVMNVSALPVKVPEL